MSATKPNTIATSGAKAYDYLYGCNRLNEDMVVQVLSDQEPSGKRIEGSFVLVKAGSGKYSDLLTEHENRVVEAEELIKEILTKENQGRKNLHLFNRNNFRLESMEDNAGNEVERERPRDLPRVGSANVKKNISEANLESLLIDNLNVLEEGLELVKQQFDCPGIGRLDLLCKDKDGNLVVVELKKFGVKHDSILDQILRYIGYIKTHVAVEGQLVRGIIVVGKIDEKLKYAVSAVPYLIVRAFNLTIE